MSREGDLRESIALNRKEVQAARRDRAKLKQQRSRRGGGPPSVARIGIASRLVQRREKRLALRRRQLAALSGAGLNDAIAWGVNLAGRVREQGANRGPYISDWIRAGGGEPGWPWCAYFAEAFLAKAGLPQYQGGLADMFRIWGNNGTNGFRRVSVGDRQPGDLVMFDWNGNGSADHIGVYIGNGRTLEGNTSSGSAGSQNDGDGLWIRQRGTGNVCAVTRPPYER